MDREPGRAEASTHPSVECPELAALGYNWEPFLPFLYARGCGQAASRKLIKCAVCLVMVSAVEEGKAGAGPEGCWGAC